MTVAELEAWIQSARRTGNQSGQVIDDYEIALGRVSTSRGWVPLTLDHLRVDHGTNELRVFVELDS